MIGKAPEPVTNGSTKKAAAKDDDDDDVDLFGSDSEDEAVEAEKVF